MSPQPISDVGADTLKRPFKLTLDPCQRPRRDLLCIEIDSTCGLAEAAKTESTCRNFLQPGIPTFADNTQAIDYM
jgi:hypothetical protein